MNRRVHRTFATCYFNCALHTCSWENCITTNTSMNCITYSIIMRGICRICLNREAQASLCVTHFWPNLNSRPASIKLPYFEFYYEDPYKYIKVGHCAVKCWVWALLYLALHSVSIQTQRPFETCSPFWIVQMIPDLLTRPGFLINETCLLNETRPVNETLPLNGTWLLNETGLLSKTWPLNETQPVNVTWLLNLIKPGFLI